MKQVTFGTSNLTLRPTASGKFNSMMLELLPIYSDSCIITIVTV